MHILLFLFNIYTYNWSILNYTNDASLINNNESLKLNKDLGIKDSSFLNLKEGSQVSLKVTNEEIYLDVKNASIIAFSAYNNYSAHIYLIKGELFLKNDSDTKIFTIETSSIVFNIMPKSSLQLTASKDAGAYKVIATLSKGRLSAYNIKGVKLTDMYKEDSFLFWKGAFIETLKTAKKKEPKISKKENDKATKKAVLSLKDVEKELFGKIQSNEEIKKELLKDFKENAIEIKKCKDCTNFSKVVFKVPDSLNLVSKNIYPDINLPAVFYKSFNSDFVNEVFSDYKISKDNTSNFIYIFSEGIYYASILAGMPFKVDIKNGYHYTYNIAAFVNPNYDVEVLSPISMQNLISIKSRPNPFFLFPGVYEFIIKDTEENINKQINIKAGSVNIIEK